jgi:hypothetical protein
MACLNPIYNRAVVKRTKQFHGRAYFNFIKLKFEKTLKSDGH